MCPHGTRLKIRARFNLKELTANKVAANLD